MTERHLTPRELADLAKRASLQDLPRTTRGVAKKALREGWQGRPRPGRTGGGGFEYPITVLSDRDRARLEAFEAGSTPASKPAEKPEAATDRDAQIDHYWQRYERAGDAHKQKAQTRLRAIQQLHRLIANGRTKTDAAGIVAEILGESTRTLFRWEGQVRGLPEEAWLGALVPNYRAGGKPAEIPAEAWDFFCSDYLRLEKPTAESCYDRLKAAARERGWQLPSLKTFLRRLDREVGRERITLAREGREALERLFPAQERDRSVFHALEALTADGHTFDVFVKWPNGEIDRPVLLAWQDLYSGKLLGWRVDRSEHKHLIQLSFGDVVEGYGIPSHVYLDNGRAFASKSLTGGTPTRYRFKVRDDDVVGLFPLLGVEVHWVTPYHGQAKPIERAFRDLADRVAKHPEFTGAYTGNRPDAKPENYGSRAVPLETFLKILGEEIARHNARDGRRTQACAGRVSFDQAFADSYAASPVRKASEQQRRLWLLTAEKVRADRRTGELRLHDNRYWSEELPRHAGEQLVVRFDPENLKQSIHVYDREGRYICAAECIGRTGFNDAAAAQQHARDKNKWKRNHRERLEIERRLSAAEVARQIPEPEATDEELDSKVVRPLFKRAAGAEDVEQLDDDGEAEPEHYANLTRMLDAIEGGEESER